ncbi:MAG: hypothetical protein K5765_01905, partial [Clostridia bacterium]|nr:hypothetical protein [Clostridia bacterium]
MTRNELIRQYYLSAKELVKNNRPKEARDFVLKILNEGVDILKTTKSIPLKVKTELFLKKWIYVSKDLYSYGTTDYVLDCFGLLDKPIKIENPDLSKKAKNDNDKSVDDKLNFDGLISCDPSVNQTIDVKNQVQLDNLEKDEIRDIEIPNKEIKKQEPKEVIVDNSNWCSNIFKDNIRIVVEIYDSDENGIIIGSGFIIYKNGYLLTNNHVLV